MSIESLKQQARRHEQNEEWQKALDQYQKAIKELARDDQSDIGLINRVGDLYVRVGSLDRAVEHYEEAVDLYREAFLPNNAIAVCKKIIRNVPNRHRAYLKIGQIRAEQGFLPDARTNFLTYAERMQQAGDLDESFRALVEFCDLAPEDVEVRITVADQMVANDRKSEAVEQLLIAYRQLTQSGERDLAAGLEKKILGLDPSADLNAALAAGAGMGSAVGVDGDIEVQFGEIELGGGFEPEPVAADESEEPAFSMSTPGEGVLKEFGEADDEEPSSWADEEEEEAAELPMMDFENEEEEEAAELPMMDFESEEEEEEAVELPTMVFDDEGEEEDAAALPTIAVEDESEEESSVELPTIAIESEEEEVEVLDSAAFGEADFGDREGKEYVTGAADVSEVDFGLSDLPTESSEALEEALEEAAPEAAPGEAQEVTGEAPSAPSPAPPTQPAAAPDEGYIDLGAMVLGGDDAKTTRFRVAYEEPSGDEDADFAKMLSQFKEKVSENLDAGDVRAHHDLGTAYKEMGLLQEAIGSFQAALRASSDHLPTYELMGQTFIEMGQPEAAARTLQRALQIKGGVEDEFVGIYYYLARAYEALDRKESAVEYYDRVFSLDINFADVTERLRELR